ncbi:MAG: peptidylprolyl isomerase [Alphaproteobacteria bacterium]|nr:peptidylprolyl isomerase [Alphaproteobacteria bacterium]
MSEVLDIGPDRVVSFSYVLRDDEGAVLDDSQGQAFDYLHGHANIVPGLEKQLLGRKVGEEVAAVVPPEEGYGIYRDDAVESVHRSAFPKDMDLQVGMPLRAENADGTAMMLWVEKIQGARVTVSANHPLAGKTLHFAVKVLGIREALPEEVAHGHVHGPDGHHHH